MEFIKNFIENVKACWSSLRGSSDKKKRFKNPNELIIEIPACLQLMAVLYGRYLSSDWVQVDIPEKEPIKDTVYTLEGSTHSLEVEKDKIILIPNGRYRFIYPTMIIPFMSITAIQFEKAIISGGYLEFITSEKDKKFPLIFAGKENSVLATEIKKYIESTKRQQNRPE